MNKIKIEANSDGKTFILSLPGGGQRHSLSPEEVVAALEHEEREYQKVVDDIKSSREAFAKNLVKP